MANQSAIVKYQWYEVALRWARILPGNSAAVPALREAAVFAAQSSVKQAYASGEISRFARERRFSVKTLSRECVSQTTLSDSVSPQDSLVRFPLRAKRLPRSLNAELSSLTQKNQRDTQAYL